MKTRNGKMKVSALALAIEGVLVAMYAMPALADDGQAAALKLPTNFVELGVSNVSHDSAKFGEYTGLNKSGAYGIGNFSVRGGDAYGDGNGTKRWAITGSDLGLTSRALDATISDQGKWNFGIGYDELRHNISDSYQTPYQGSMGGNSFSLPGFGAAANTRALSAPQLGAFHNVDISSTRKNALINGGFNLNRQWDITFDFNELNQSGAKLQAFGVANLNGATNQTVSILPMPTNYKTNTVNLAVNWLGDKGHATGSYFGSFFRDNYNSVTFQPFTGLAVLQTMSTAPSNDFHQANLTGGYAFSARTKLAGGLSYGRNTQNTPYAYDTGMMVTPSPTASLGGYVATTHADLKLTDQTTKDLALSAGLKYDLRDNRTSSNIYNFQAISGSAGNIANYPNTPLSIKKTQLELAGDYRLDQKQKIRLAYDHEQISRQCNQYAAGGGVTTSPIPYAAGTNCVTATDTKDDKLSATYRRKAGDAVNLNVGYSYSDRKSTFDQNARAAMIGINGNPNISVPATSLIGLNAGDIRGFNPFFEASRKQQMLKAGVNWQATDKLSVTAGGRYTDDDYGSTYGVQKGKTWSLNLDTTYSYKENGSISAYVTRQERQRDMTNIQTNPTGAATTANATRVSAPAGATWNNRLTDDDTTIGLNAKQGGLMAGKLELAGDLTYSLGTTGYNTTLNYTTLSTGLLGCADPAIMMCGSLPDIKSTMTQFKLSGTYMIDKSAKVAVGYLYRRLHSDDYFYNAYQYPYNPSSVMPTNQTAPSYSVNVVWASYIYSFK
jgi:MtrB/PioB family decaheme-associated outer membrane protein